MKRITYILLQIVLLLGMTSCDSIRRRHQAGVVAELNGQVLTEEVLGSVCSGMTSEDSLRAAELYIKQWAIDILQSEKAMSSQDERIEAMVADYRRSLYMHEYEQALVARKMPRDVDDSVLLAFYHDHRSQLVLRENILKGILIVLPKNSPKLDKLRKLLAHPTEETLEKIEKYAYQYSSGYELFTDQWRTTNDILMRLPLERDILQQEMRKQSLIEVEDSTTLYLLQVTEKYFAGDCMPFDYASDAIQQIVLTDRQMDFLRAARERLYLDAVRYKKLKIYNTDEKSRNAATAIVDKLFGDS